MYVEIKGDIVNTDSENFGVRKFDFLIVISIFYVVLQFKQKCDKFRMEHISV